MQANSTPSEPSPTSINAGQTYAGEGWINHNRAVAVTHSRVAAAIHGLRLPPWSAIAPKMGPPMATSVPDTASIVPHSMLPTASSDATCCVKYAANRKVWMTVGKALLAQSYMAHEIKATRECCCPESVSIASWLEATFTIIDCA